MAIKIKFQSGYSAFYIKCNRPFHLYIQSFTVEKAIFVNKKWKTLMNI